MGQTNSKSPTSATQHIFKSETPVHFSQELIDSLQASSETDGTRAKDAELHIQRRVHDELSRLDQEARARLRQLEEALSASESLPPSILDAPTSTSNTNAAQRQRASEMGREGVQREVAALRQRLQRRRVRDEVINDVEVESARRSLVTCLRINDRRPLDCWREVEAFKKEVGRLENEFLGGVLR